MLIFWCVSFVWPVAEIVLWSAHDAWAFVDARLWERIANSLLIATGAAFVTLWMAVLMWVAKRYYNSRWILWALRLSGLGYGIPGTVIAVGWMVSLTLIFGSFHHLPFVVLAALILGLATRFLSLAQRPLDAASERISKQLEEAARSLGASRDRVCWLIHRPLLSGAMGIGFLFVFIDSIKEMPMTLLMRPFGWDTLSVRVYQFTSDGLWQAAAAPALVIVLVSTLPLFVLRKQLR
jgi:iron(III) transport system permease protein